MSGQIVLALQLEKCSDSLFVDTKMGDDIGQEEYMGGDDIGKLDCGHEFHTHCIKQWLTVKNLCPICKMTGLET